MNNERLMKVLLSPVISDKAYRVAEQDKQVVFRVMTCANKLEIKKAVERMFEVKVAAVKTTNVKGKARRFGRIEGRTKDWKKAYVKLMPGYDIDFVGAAE